MANFILLPRIILLCFLIFTTTASARIFGRRQLNINDGGILIQTGNFSDHVCEPSRFAKLGLKMNDFAYCNKSLPYEIRAKDLIDRMTLLEKSHQIGDAAVGVERLGLPKYEWWSEALHGVSNVGQTSSIATFFDEIVPGATSFPTVISMAASFNQSKWKTIGQAVSTEARAMYNLGHAGLTFWSPNINVVRDPRWGRALETPGEDPFVVGTYATNYVRGLQDVEGTENIQDLNTRPLKVAACCKHYAAYDIDNWIGVDRYHFDAKVQEQDMVESFVRPFEMCVKDGDVASVMCSYNKVNGLSTCADPKLLKDTIRGEWNLHGYIVSDCDSIEVMVNAQKFLQGTPEDAVALALKAGLDLDCGYFYPQHVNDAVIQGKVSESEIDSALKNNYITLMRLGFFDGNPAFKYLGKDNICSEDHIELAAEAAREGMVLLKNNQTLPLNYGEVKTLAVVGPHANATEAMIGNYAGIPCRYISPFNAFSAYASVKYEMGCANVACTNDTFIFNAMEAAKNADATVLLVGLDLSIEAESLDRTDLLLPGYQNQLIKQVSSVSKGPVILVVLSAGGVDITDAKNDPNIKAILWAGYPGEEGGRGIADVVFGKYNPGGKLPLTWYENNYVDKLPMTSLPFRPIENLSYPGRTYKFYDGPTVYPFGFGLSYTNFTSEIVSSKRSLHIKLDKLQHCHDINYINGSYKPPCPTLLLDDLKCDADSQLQFDFVVKVNNTGKRDGSEVVTVYNLPPAGIDGAPLKQLIGFERVFIPAGGSKEVKFAMNACKSLFIVDFSAYRLLPAGQHKIVIGDNIVSFPLQVEFDY